MKAARSVARDWGLALGPPFPAGHSFAAPAGPGAVLKIVAAADDESTHEAAALTFWDGDGAVRLLRYDAARRALLLERAVPGGDASRQAEGEAIEIAVGVGRRLWRRVPDGAPYQRIADRVPGWLANAGAHELADAARAAYATLRPRADVLVHGDLHHHNLLRHGERWIAIDPKPILGEPEFDVVTLLWNPIGHAPTSESVRRRVALLARAGLDADRVRAWAIVRGAYLGLPLPPGVAEDRVPQLRVARALL